MTSVTYKLKALVKPGDFGRMGRQSECAAQMSLHGGNPRKVFECAMSLATPGRYAALRSSSPY